MAKLPAFQFYPGDWMKDPALRACSIAARGLWTDMLCLMFESVRRGYLQHATGKPVTAEQLARMTGCSTDEVSRLLQELDDSGVFSRTDHGVIYSRRMARDEVKRGKCSEAGKRGGNPTLKGESKGRVKGGSKGQPKGDANRKPTPSSSSSSSPSGEEEVASQPPPDGGGRKVPDSPFHRSIDVFVRAWEGRHGGKYPFQRGRDNTAMKQILEALGGDEAKFAEIAPRYIADDEPFVAGNGHNLAILAMKLARYLVGPAATQPPRRGIFGDDPMDYMTDLDGDP